ncbi:MAG: hypothetical protein AAB583_04960, partial [Patescibacteria group bacterium]
DAIKDALVAGVITEGHVRPLISLGDANLMLDLFKRILRENSTVRQTEEEARKLKGEIQKKEPRTVVDRLWIPELDELAKKIQKAFGLTKVIIYQSRNKGRIVIEVNGDVEVTGPVIKKICGKLLALEPN